MLSPPLGLEWAVSHAALPTVEAPLGDDAVRILFSPRDADGRASIGRADVSLAGGAPIVHPAPLLTAGPLGAFDDSGVTVSSFVRDGARTLLYYTGWSLGVSVPFNLFAGCAVSTDGGATFDRVSTAPLLERSDVDPFLTASPWVLAEDGVWRMWYVSAVGWSATDDGARHRYHIRYAESDDGLAWRREGHVAVDFANEDEYALSRPCVVKDGDVYRMWFSARGDTYRLAYAESEDGLDWTRADTVELAGETDGWDAHMQAYPAVFDLGGRRWMLYNGDGYGRTGVGLALGST